MTKPAAVKPNLIELTGEEIEIVYSINLVGRPQLTYNGETFTEFESVTTSIGTLLTVPKVPPANIADASTQTLSLLLPDINLREHEEKFKTLAILTTHHTSIGGPGLVIGPLQTYHTVKLHGVARIVETLQHGA